MHIAPPGIPFSTYLFGTGVKSRATQMGLIIGERGPWSLKGHRLSVPRDLALSLTQLCHFQDSGLRTLSQVCAKTSSEGGSHCNVACLGKQQVSKYRPQST